VIVMKRGMASGYGTIPQPNYSVLISFNVMSL
jgi:hypothetical protein